MAALMKVSLATLNSIDPKAQSEAVLSEIGRLLGAERGFIFLNQEYMLQQDTKVEKEMDESESENENVKSA